MNSRSLRWVASWAGVVLAMCCLSSPPAPVRAGDKSDKKDEKTASRFFELRTYTAHPGKLEALHKRFREHTNRLFQKHGMQLVGYWTPTDGPEKENTLIYILAYPSQEARDQSWEAFRNDSEWKKAYEESHKDGPIVMKVESTFLHATEYSPIK